MPPPRTEESTGGPAKVLAIFLAIVCAILGYALYKKGGASNTVLETTTKSRDTLSNQVDVLNTKLMEEQGNHNFAKSNLQYALERRTGEAHFFSNRVVQTLLRLTDAQREARTAQTDLQTKTAAGATLEAQKEDLIRNLQVVPRLQEELAETKARLAQIARDRDELALAVGRLRVDMAEVERTLNDPASLRFQLKKAEEAAQVRKATAAGQPVRFTDRKVQLEMGPDGVVRPVASDASGGGTKK